MKFTIEELTRLIGYIAGIVAGLGFIAFGLINGDLPTALAGAGMLGLGGVAGLNVNKSAPEATHEELVSQIVETIPIGEGVGEEDADDVIQFPTAGSEPVELPKHA